MRLFNMITEEEKEMITLYRKNYSGSYTNESYCSNEHFLRFWEKNKNYNPVIKKIFKSSLSISKDILIEATDEELKETLRANIFSGEKTLFFDYLDAGIKEVIREIDANDENNDLFTLRHYLNYFSACCTIDPVLLVTNRYTGEEINYKLPNGKKLLVTKNTKYMKVLKHVCETIYEAFPNPYLHSAVRSYEGFRLEHSRILNQKSFRGKLTISIHPLDFITMSDNECDWTSCMNWDGGEYRAGTLEMMNSSEVIVAFLESAQPMKTWKGLTWNNKKWRQLFIVNEEMALGVKGYPYQSLALQKEVLKLIEESVEGHSYDREGQFTSMEWGNYRFITTSRNPSEDEDAVAYPYFFDTDLMYNDFNSEVISAALLSTTFFSEESSKSLNYSGIGLCVTCGSPLTKNKSEVEELSCPDCLGKRQCFHCGEYIDEDEAIPVLYEDNEVVVCHYCRCNLELETDLFTGDYIYSSFERETVVLLSDEEEVIYDNPYHNNFLTLKYIFTPTEEVKKQKFAQLQALVTSDESFEEVILKRYEEYGYVYLYESELINPEARTVLFW